jgi:hypothetical protein
MVSRLEPHYELRNFLRNNLTDLNSTNRGGANWIYADWPSSKITSKNVYPRVIVTKINESGEIIGLGETDTYDSITLQIDVVCNKEVGILTKTTTDESIGVISNSPRISFDDVPNSVTNIKHNGTAFGTVTAKNDDASFTAPGSLAAGTVEWSRSTGNLNFGSADLASYSGQTITSTYVLSMDNEMTVKWIARQIIREIRADWKTDTTIGSLLHPKKISGPTLIPYDREPGLSRVIIEYQFNRFNTGE